MIVLAACCVLLPAQRAARADQLDDLLKGIASDSEEARVEARQLLPRFGAKAVPRLIPLIADEREVVWRAAFNVIADAGNQVCVPGREQERISITREILKLLAPERSEHEKLQGLRLIPFVLPDDYPVAEIAALLKEEGLIRERARAALEEARTFPACLALIKALEIADADFQYAVLCSLANFAKSPRISAKVPVAASVVPYAENPSARVRAGAARVLGAGGDPRYVAILKEIRGAADDDTAFECGDAQLLLADAMILKGGNFDAALNLYAHVLETESDPVLRGGALAGLGRFGDERGVRMIVAALQSPNGGEIEAPALNALQTFHGYAACMAVLQAYPGLSEEQRLVLIGGFGRSGDPLYIDLLLGEARSSDERFRVAAVGALAEMQHPGAVDGLVGLASGGEGAAQAAATRSLGKLATAFAGSGNMDAAGKAYLGLYRAARNDDEKLAALEGIKRYPTPDAYDVLVQTMSEEELSALPDGTLGGIAESLWHADRKAEAQATFEKLLGRVKTTSGLEQAVRLAGVMGKTDQLRDGIGVVRNFLSVGPFKWSMAEGFSGQLPLDPANPGPGKEIDRDGARLSWKPLRTEDMLGIVDLMGAFGEQANACAFAYTEIEMAEAVEAQVRAGSDDGIKIWVNGQPVHENNVDRGSALDQDIAACTLASGKNTILVQITQGAGGWNFRLRLTKPDGTPLQFKEMPPGL